MIMNIEKVYVTVTEGNKRVELKFKTMPEQKEIEDAFAQVIKPVPEINQCPMNNPKCPLYKEE